MPRVGENIYGNNKGRVNNAQGIATMQSGNNKVRGLTSRDRSDSDNAAIARTKNKDYYYVLDDQTKKPIKNDPVMNIVRQERKKSPFFSYYDLAERNRNSIKDNYFKELNKYTADEYLSKNNISITDIKTIASKVLPAFNQYSLKGYFDDITDEQWKELAKSYDVMKNTMGQDEADSKLSEKLKTIASYKQPILEKYWHGILGAGTTFGGSIISMFGMVAGFNQGLKEAAEHKIAEATTPISDRNKLQNDPNYNDKLEVLGSSFIGNVLNKTLDNPITRYGNDVVETGAILPDQIKLHKEAKTQNNEIITPAERDNGQQSVLSYVFDRNTLPELLKQSGFTTAAIVEAEMTAGVGRFFFKGLKGATILARSKNIIDNTETARNIIRGIRSAENAYNAVVVPGVVGSTEGVIEGLQTKQQVWENGLRDLNEYHQSIVTQEVEEKLRGLGINRANIGNNEAWIDKNGIVVNDNVIADIYNQVWNSHKEEFDASIDQLEFAASKAGIHNFIANSAINGFLNATLKAGLHSPSVQKSLQNNRLTKWALPKENFNITQVNGRYSVTPNVSKKNLLFSAAKEPVGEFTEEYLQSLSNDTFSGAASNNIHTFIKRKYDGDATVAVGDQFATDFTAALSSLANSAISKESLKAGLMGAMGSAFGSFSAPHKAVNANGNRGFFVRGQNADGSKESMLSAITRVMPWRSGITSNIRSINDKRDLITGQAQALEEWLNDPTKRDLFNSGVGTMAWAREMETSAKLNDEFGYRNSRLGRTISSVFMLEQAEGTEVHDAIMTELARTANLEEGSKEANDYVEMLKSNADAASNFEDMSDSQILQEVKKNANKMLDYIDKVKQESKNIDRLYGDVDTDTKQALIYAHIAEEDFIEREKQLKEENALTRNLISHDVNEEEENRATDLSTEEKKVLSTYGSFREARKALARMTRREEDIKRELEDIRIDEHEDETLNARVDIREDIKRLKRRKNKSDAEKKILKEKEEKLKELEKKKKVNDKSRTKELKVELKGLRKEKDALNKNMEAIEKEYTEGQKEDKVLSISDILSLDSKTRARMLLNGMKRFYTEAHKIKENNDENADENEGTVNVVSNYYSEEQQAVIDKLMSIAKKYDDNFLDKELDAVRLSDQIERMQQQEIALMYDNKILSNYANKQKQAAKTVVEKEKFDSMSKIQDYTEFADTMSQYLTESSPLEIQRMAKAMRNANNENFKKYEENTKSLTEITKALETSDTAKQMDQNSLDLFATAVSFLQNREVDLEDARQVYDALNAKSNEDQSITEFEEFVDKLNSAADKSIASNGDIIFTSSAEVYDDYIRLMHEVKSNREERETNNRPIQIDTSASSVRREAPDPKPAEERKIERGEEKPIVEAPGEKGDIVLDEENFNDENKGDTENSIINNARKHNNNNIVSAINSIISGIKEAVDKSEIYKEENLEKALNLLKDALQDRENITEQDLNDILTSIANNLDINDNDDAPVISLMDIGKTALRDTARARARNRIEEDRKRPAPLGNENAGTIGTRNIQALLNSTSEEDAPLRDYLIKHNVEEFLSGAYQDLISSLVSHMPDIYFLTDNALTEEVKSKLGDSFTIEDTPIIAVIRHEKGAIEIDGHKYQPIGILPSPKDSSLGSKRVTPLIQSIQREGGLLIRLDGEDKKAIVTLPNGTSGGVKANHIDRGETISNNLGDLIEKKMTPEERNDYNNRGDTTAWSRIVNGIIDRLRIGKLPGSTKDSLLYYPRSMSKRGVGEGSPIKLYIKGIEEATNKNGKTLIDVINDNSATAEDIKHYNSITEKLFRKLNTCLSTHLKKIGESPITEISSKLENLEEVLNKEVRRCFYINQNYSIKINKIEGEYAYNIELINNSNLGEIITLAQHVTEKDVKDDVIADILSFLLVDDSGSIRKESSTNKPIATYQVDYTNAETANSESEHSKEARDELKNCINDGLFYVKATELDYKPEYVEIQAPYNSEGKVVYDSERDTQNAAPISRVGANEEKQGGVVYESQSGAVVEGEVKSAEQQGENVQFNINSAINSLLQESSELELLDDELGYVNTRTGRLYARVTDTKYASETSEDERFDGNSDFALPSSTVGNIVDQIIRDFFNPNASMTITYTISNISENSNLLKENPSTRKFMKENNINNIYVRQTNNGEKVELVIVGDAVQVVLSEEEGRNYFPELSNNIIDNLTKYGLVTVDEEGKSKLIENEETNNALAKYLENLGKKTTRYKYPNIPEAQVDAIVEKLKALKATWETQGWHIVSEGVKAFGTINVNDGVENKELDVAGTLDLFLYKDNGDAMVIDVKTIRNVNKIDGNIEGWTFQTSNYRNFIANRYGFNFVGQMILPFNVGYDAPSSSNPYTTEEREGAPDALMRNGSEALVTINMLPMIKLEHMSSPQLLYDKLSEQSKKIQLLNLIGEEARSENGPIKVTFDEEAQPIDPYIGDVTVEDDFEDNFEDDVDTDFSEEIDKMPVVRELNWEKLPSEYRELLEKAGYTKEIYESLNSQEEKDNNDSCIFGV